MLFHMFRAHYFMLATAAAAAFMSSYYFTLITARLRATPWALHVIELSIQQAIWYIAAKRPMSIIFMLIFSVAIFHFAMRHYFTLMPFDVLPHHARRHWCLCFDSAYAILPDATACCYFIIAISYVTDIILIKSLSAKICLLLFFILLPCHLSLMFRYFFAIITFSSPPILWASLPST